MATEAQSREESVDIDRLRSGFAGVITCETSATDARNRFPELVDRAAFGHERFLILKQGKPRAAIISARDLQVLQDHEDRRMSALVEERLRELVEHGRLPAEVLEDELAPA